MRSFFIDKKPFNLVYKVLTVVLVVIWSLFALFGVHRFITIKYLYPLKFSEQVFYNADYYSLDRALVFSVIKTESSFNERATSSKGAKGLMQITDKTGEYIANLIGKKSFDLYDASTNINFGCYYINRLREQFLDMETALIAYNAGEGNVREWLKNQKYSADGKTIKEIPFKETKDYIKKIKENFTKYKKLYGNILDKR